MLKFSIFVRKMLVDPSLSDMFSKSITSDDKVAPGQLRVKGDWFYLTYLKTFKIKNFDSVSYDLVESTIDQIRVVVFKFIDDKLILKGGKSDLKEIAAYFEALSTSLAKNDGKSELFKIEPIVIDLNNILIDFENLGEVADVKKLKVKKLEVNLGRIESCMIKTQDYGAVKKTLDEDETVFGMEIFLKAPDKTTVYFDVDGMVRVCSKSDDVDTEELTLGFVSKIK